MKAVAIPRFLVLAFFVGMLNRSFDCVAEEPSNNGEDFIALPRDWFVTLFPSQDVAVNFLDGGNWFFPFDFLIGKNLSRRVVTSLEISVPIVKQYGSCNFKLEARMSYFF